MDKKISIPMYDPDILQFEEFWIRVTAANNSKDIKGIILDDIHIKNMNKLSKEMKIYYNSEDAEVDKFVIGNYYAVFDDQWHRVKCLNCDFHRKIASVFFVDRGDNDDFPFTELQILPPKFCQMPAQFVSLSMNNLEIFYDHELMEKFMNDYFENQDVYVKVVKKNNYSDVPILSSQFFVEDEEMNLNEIILKQILDSMDLNKITKEGALHVAKISHVEENNLFMQINNKAFEYLNRLLEKAVLQIQNNHNINQSQIKIFQLEKLYLVNSSKENVDRKDLISIQDISEILDIFPKQAIEVKLHTVSPKLLHDEVIEYLQQLAKCSDPFLVKIIDHQQDVPIVQLCKRGENNQIISINDILPFETPLQFFHLKYPSKNINFKLLELPEDGSYFDVHITMASRPDDITIQLLCNLFKLKRMTIDLTESCESFSGTHLQSDDIHVGNAYAALNIEDDTWFRAYVYKRISQSAFAVFSVDYGDYRIVRLDDLLPLPDNFCEIPCQAVKGRLARVSNEIVKNWSAIESLKLNDLIVSKNFVAHITDREFNSFTVNKVVLNLELINTSTEEDININEVIESWMN
ncbi:hypothetical protein TKK_0001837 [Trichogramma kaykai]|uniref:Tudor domain-containing protein n=1 Tax=Trichogramma kaykai TaxID=54128 RepID=A0ABD2XGL3_9HYME